MCVCVCVCVYVCVYIYIYTHTHIHTRIIVYQGSFPGPRGHWDIKSVGHLGLLAFSEEQSSPELMSDYGEQSGRP